LAPTRCAKIRSFGRHPFATLQRNAGGLPLAKLPDHLKYTQPKSLAKVAVLPLVPGFAVQLLTTAIDSGIQGIILECFGNGTGPSNDLEFLNGLQRAYEQNIVVVAITQCQEGGILLDIYEAGNQLRRAGVLSGGGMTREAALGKLHALLGAGLTFDEVRRLVERDLCGELS
jgi:L-asparaginase